jgi:predicted RNase H-like HicB family nuclease
MANLVFVAIVSGNQTAGYRAGFPDLLDCSAEGRDMAELLVNARQALSLRLEKLVSSDEPFPDATPIESIVVSAGEFVLPVDVTVDDTPVRINISLGERLVQRLDAAAERRGMTRSGFIAQSVRVSLGETYPGAADWDAAGRRMQEELSSLGRKLNDSLGPDSAFSRRMADLDDVIYDGVRKAADKVSAAMAKRQASTKKEDPAEAPQT